MAGGRATGTKGRQGPKRARDDDSGAFRTVASNKLIGRDATTGRMVTFRSRPVSAKVAGPKEAKLGTPVARAISELAETGRLTGARSEKISARVDPGVMEAAAERLGLRRTDVSDVVNAALALAAAPDRFKTWLRTTEDTLPDDFELAV